MISSVSMSSTLSMMSSSGVQRQAPPPDKDAFKVADSDSDGVLSVSEFETLAAGIEEVTGNTINVEETLASYDADEDGSLSGEELFSLMASQGFDMGGLMTAEEGGQMAPPPPPPADQVSAAYGQNSGEDTLSQLMALLSGTSESEEGYTTLEVSV